VKKNEGLRLSYSCFCHEVDSFCWNYNLIFNTVFKIMLDCSVASCFEI